MTFAVYFDPVFLVPDDPAQGIDKWTVRFEGLEPFAAGSPRQIKWAEAIRVKAMEAFIRHSLKDDDEAILKRHWYDARTMADQTAAEEAFTAYFTPIVEWADSVLDWIDALPMDRIQEDPTIIPEITEMMRITGCNPELHRLRRERQQRKVKSR